MQTLIMAERRQGGHLGPDSLGVLLLHFVTLRIHFINSSHLKSGGDQKKIFILIS